MKLVEGNHSAYSDKYHYGFSIFDKFAREKKRIFLAHAILVFLSLSCHSVYIFLTYLSLIYFLFIR